MGNSAGLFAGFEPRSGNATTLWIGGPDWLCSRMACVRRLLSQLGPCRVESCTCGVVHLSIGAISVRLSNKHATQLTQALVAASAEFESDDTISAAELPGRKNSGDEGPPSGGSQVH